MCCVIMIAHIQNNMESGLNGKKKEKTNKRLRPIHLRYMWTLRYVNSTSFVYKKKRHAWANQPLVTNELVEVQRLHEIHPSY